MPGVGKTQLALKFATVAFQRGQHAYIFWVSAVSLEKVAQDFSKLADLVRLAGRHTMDQASKLTAMRGWLEDPPVGRSWLLVLDNVSQETAGILRDVLPRKEGEGRLLMTTRMATIADMFTASGVPSQLALQVPGVGDAVAMLSAGAGADGKGRTEGSHTDAERLVQTVGNLPLAIDQAASYMRETGSSPREMLDIYHSDDALEVSKRNSKHSGASGQLMRVQILSWENELSRHEEKSVMVTFTLALNRIQHTAPDAMTLLRLFCFCDPEGIPISIFQQGCDVLQDALRRKSRQDTVDVPSDDKLAAVQDLFQSRIRLSKAIQVIQRLSLAVQTREETDRVIRIHDLVHLLLRLKFMTDIERRQWLKIAIYIIYKGFEAIGDRRSPLNWNRCGQFISHIESLEGFAEQYGLENSKILDASTWAAVYLEVYGLYGKAAALNKRILNQKKNLLGPEHPSTLTSMNNLAGVLGSQGKYKEAERMHRRTLTLSESVLGTEHPDTLTSMNSLALVLGNQGKTEEAERILRRTLALRESILGKQHPSTLTSMNNLAGVLSRQGKYEEAERMHLRTLTLSESILGTEHPDTLTSMNSLALVLDNQGKTEEAERILRRTLALRESILGKQHPSTLISMNNLAGVLSRQGKYEEAERMHLRTLTLRESMLGTEHPDTLTSMNSLALVLGNQGKTEEAERILRRTLTLSESVLGKKGPDTISAISSLEITVGDLGRMEDAEKMKKEVLENWKPDLGEVHPEAFEFVDSAYGTASHGRQDDNNPSRPENSDSIKQDTDDARSEYSVLSISNSIMDTYAQDFAADLVSAVDAAVTDPKRLMRLCEVLQDLLRHFAFRINYEMQSKEGREIMFYVHQNRRCALIFTNSVLY